MEYLEFRFPGRRMGQRRYIGIEGKLSTADLDTLSDSITSYLDEKGLDEKQSFNVYDLLDVIEANLNVMLIDGAPVRWHYVKYADKPALRTYSI
jgi:hypothetical protein